MTYRFFKSFLFPLDMLPSLNALLDFALRLNKYFFSGKNLQVQAIFYSSNSGKQQHICFIVWFGISEKYSHGVNYFNICLSRITILWLLGQHGLYYNTNTWLSLWFFLWKLSRMFEKLGHVFWSKFDQRTYQEFFETLVCKKQHWTINRTWNIYFQLRNLSFVPNVFLFSIPFFFFKY